MIKASAGGGGKGMRIAWDDKEARSELNLMIFKITKRNTKHIINRWQEIGKHISSDQLGIEPKPI